MHRQVRVCLLAAALLLSLSAVRAQQSEPSQTPVPSQAPVIGPTPPDAISGNRGNDTRPRSDMSTQPVSAVVSGRVVMEGGGRLPDEVAVQTVCGGTYGPLVYTRDRFRVAAGHTHYLGAAPGSSPLVGCEVLATLSGFHPATAPVTNPSAMGSDVGILVLRPRDNVGGFTYSITTALAPKEARKAYERGLQWAYKGKLDEALKELENAVRIYPAYAIAWFELGTVYHRLQRSEEAFTAYQRSVEADAKFVKPILQLAMIRAGERNWQETAKLTDRVIAMNPFEFPQAFLYHAAANYNLRDLQVAEKSARRAIELDPQHRLLRAFYLLGMILAARGDVVTAAENLRAYLKYAPKSPDGDAVRKKLAEIERGG